MAQQRASHLAQQARKDALARLRAGKIANVHLISGEKVRVRPPKADEALGNQRVLVLHNRRLVAVLVNDKDCVLRFSEITSRKIQLSDVLGVVI
jgi:hypothetical protein